MKLRKLRIALAVASSGAVATAARELGLSQPAVTRAVQSLEQEIRIPLFHRSSRALVCTAAGAKLIARVARAQDHLRLAEAELAGDHTAGRLSHQLTAQAADHEFAAFLGVAAEGTVSAAARASGLSQPALNRSLRGLENRLNLSLFYRTPGGMRLTPAGEILLGHSKLALSEIRQALEEVEILKGAKGGYIRIGALPLTCVRLVPLAVENLLRTYKSAEISIIGGTYESMLASLRLGDIDVLVGTIRQPVPIEGLTSEELFDDDIVVVAGADHPLAGRKSVALRDCLKWGWVLPFKNVPLRMYFEKFLDAASLPYPQQVIESDSIVAVRTLLMQGNKLALLSRHQVHHEVGWGYLNILPVRFKNVLRPVGLTLRSDYTPTPLAQALLQELRAVATEMRTKRRHQVASPAKVASGDPSRRNDRGLAFRRDQR